MRRILLMALRNLGRRRKRTAITLIALTIGFGLVTIMKSVINAQQQLLVDDYVKGQLGALQIHHKGFLENITAAPLTLDMPQSPELLAKIRSVPHVVEVSGRITFPAFVSMPTDDPTQPGKTGFVNITAVDWGKETRITGRQAEWLSEGTMLGASEAPELVLNSDVMVGLGAKVSKDLPADRRLWPALIAPDRDRMLNGESVKFVGAMGAALPGDKKFGYTNLAFAQKLLRMEGRVTEYAVGIDSLDHLAEVQGQLQKLLGPDYEVSSWEEIVPFTKDLRHSQNVLFGVITTMFIIVILLGVTNTMLTNVLERMKEIGTLRAFGMHGHQVAALFVGEGAFIGLLGGILGMIFGGLMVWHLHHKGINMPAPGTHVKAMVWPFLQPSFLLWLLGYALVGASVASLWPAMRASKLNPAEVLRKV